MPNFNLKQFFNFSALFFCNWIYLSSPVPFTQISIKNVFLHIIPLCAKGILLGPPPLGRPFGRTHIGRWRTTNEGNAIGCWSGSTIGSECWNEGISQISEIRG
jgi:hypothetical protein